MTVYIYIHIEYVRVYNRERFYAHVCNMKLANAPVFFLNHPD